MFDEVTKQEGGKTAARKGAYLLGSSALQALFVAVIVFIGGKIAADVVEQAVEVKFVRSAAPPPPPPPPPPAPARKSPPRKPNAKKVVKPFAMIQPKDIPDEFKPPEKKEEEEEIDYGPSDGTASSTGEVGGFGPGGGGGIEEAPVYATAGFKPPAESPPGCVRGSIRIPKDLQGLVAKVTLKFAVSRDGSTDLYQFMTPVPDKRIEDAIKAGISSCKFNAGTDAQGKPVRIWVILPLRFQAS